jgi:hypothetical protein
MFPPGFNLCLLPCFVHVCEQFSTYVMKKSSALTLLGWVQQIFFWPDPCLQHAIRLTWGSQTAIAAHSGVGRALLNLRQSMTNGLVLRRHERGQVSRGAQVQQDNCRLVRNRPELVQDGVLAQQVGPNPGRGVTSALQRMRA